MERTWYFQKAMEKRNGEDMGKSRSENQDIALKHSGQHSSTYNEIAD